MFDFQLYRYKANSKELIEMPGTNGIGYLDKRLSLSHQHSEVRKIARQRKADGYQILTKKSDKEVYLVNSPCIY